MLHRFLVWLSQFCKSGRGEHKFMCYALSLCCLVDSRHLLLARGCHHEVCHVGAVHLTMLDNGSKQVGAEKVFRKQVLVVGFRFQVVT